MPLTNQSVYIHNWITLVTVIFIVKNAVNNQISNFQHFLTNPILIKIPKKTPIPSNQVHQ